LQFEENTDYPVGILGDIKIHFNHYKNKDETLEKWNKRKQRIDFDNLYIITSDERLSDDELQRLNQIECKMLIIFTALDKSGYPNTFQMKRYEKQGYVSQYSVREPDGFREFERVFNYAKWLNGEPFKKVAFVLPPILPMPPVKGGALETLVNHILKHNESTKEFDFTVFCIADKAAERSAEGYKQTRFCYISENQCFDRCYDLFKRGVHKLFGFYIQSDLRYLRKVKKALLKESYETVIVENAQGFILPIKKSVRAKMYFHLHNDYLYKGVHNAEKILSACDCVLAVSKYIKKQVLAVDSESQDKITVLENCIDTDVFKITPFAAEIRRKYEISTDCCLFIYSGRIIPQKGVRELIKAFGNVKGNVKLMLVGEAWYSSKIITPYMWQIRRLAAGMNEKVIFAGFVDYEKMPDYYSAADVCIVPSVVEEGSPLVINEALCCGLPVIATNSGGIPEKINDTCSILVERGETMEKELTMAMQYLYDNAELRKTMGAEGRKLMDTRNVQHYYSAFQEIFK
jgi:glycosyltransferase involved in cell wall biosynthesis